MSKIRTFARYRDGDIEFNAHTCPGLRTCPDHPRWHVVKIVGLWIAFGPNYCLPYNVLRDHAQAFIHAQKEATK